MMSDPSETQPAGDAALTLWPSPPRRWLAIVMLAGLGALLVLLSVQPGGSALARLGLAAFGVLALAAAEAQRRATRAGIVLGETMLCDTDGQVIAPLDQIEAVERGFLVFKPAGGFVLRLSQSAPFRWAPGLWWRQGRRIGIGGVISAAEGRAMAELLATRVAQR